MSNKKDAIVYAIGLCSLGICVKKGFARDRIEESANLYHPTGISSRWEIADEDFADGNPNPSPCNTQPDEREHYLLHC